VSDCGPNGTTGGGDAEPVTVTDAAALKEAMNSSDPQVIYLSGTIQTPGNFSGRHNKTLIGINNAEIVGGSGLVGCTNVIVKNIRFRDGPNDSFGLSGSACIWLDHCEFLDGTDGNLDIVNGTDFVTISWSRFYYTRGHDHMLSTLVGNTQPHEGDVGRENITFHHNWWGAGVSSRKPRVRYGQVHLFNNYYHYTSVAGDSGDNYDIGAGFESRLLVENNYFDGSNEPITWMSDEGTAEVVERNNEFVNAGGVVTRGSAFEPPYEYEHAMEPAQQVRDSVTAGAGVQ
jgi:pectate lyase